LLDAWRLLANEGYYPSLALTIAPSYANLVGEIEQAILSDGLNIINFGNLSQSAVFKLYKSSSALIYPSLSESLGLPLIEASKFGIPIVAAELDYVRDSCIPEQTFDPSSSISISRAVKRFSGFNCELDKVSSTEKFISLIKSFNL
jgi:glycosyltransferase involved in cell wall biosynthesis